MQDEYKSIVFLEAIVLKYIRVQEGSGKLDELQKRKLAKLREIDRYLLTLGEKFQNGDKLKIKEIESYDEIIKRAYSGSDVSNELLRIEIR